MALHTDTEVVGSKHIVWIDCLLDFAKPVILFLVIMVIWPATSHVKIFAFSHSGIRAPQHTPIFFAELFVWPDALAVVSRLLLLCYSFCKRVKLIVEAVEDANYG